MSLRTDLSPPMQRVDTLMQERVASLPDLRTTEALSLHQLVGIARRRWVWMLALLLAAPLVSLAISMFLPKWYEAQVVTIPQDNQRRGGLLDSVSGQASSLAALAGITLGNDGQKYEAIEMLRSEILARQFIREDNLLPVLFAGDWDARNHAWSGRVRTLNDGVLYFDRHVRNVIEDRRTGLVTLRIEWRDPVQAAAWANELVRRANEQLRERALARAQRAVTYLQGEALKTDSVEVREALYRLLEQQYKDIVLANVTDEYALTVIDPAVAADRKHYIFPDRVLFGIGGLFVGLVGCWLIALVAANKEHSGVEG